MKRVRVYNDKVDVVLEIDWDNYLMDDCPQLNLKKEDSLVIFYRNKREEYKFESIPVYTKVYHPKEKMEYLLAKQPNIQKLIDNFELALSV